MKDDLISRQAVLALPRNRTRNMKGEVVEETIDVAAIRGLPPAQPETAKRIVGKSRDGMTLWYQCDMCNEPVDAQDNFCRGCGRRLTDG